MDKTSHTPGPWVVGCPDDQTIRADGLRVASVECPRKEWRSNARLIAAAPELLAACQDALAVEIEAGWPDSELASRLRAAIAKATGGQP